MRVWGRGVLTISDVTIRDCEGAGIGSALAEVRARRVVIERSPAGISARSIRAAHVEVHDARYAGIYAEEGLAVYDVTVRRTTEGPGLRAAEVRGVDLEATDNSGDGVDARERASLVRLLATGNGGFGISAGSFLRLLASTVTGNGIASGGIDVASRERPLVRRTTCGRSLDLDDPPQDLDVCANDP